MLRPELGPGYGAPLSDIDALKRTLSAVKGRRGLVHGHFKNGGVCALGAVAVAADRSGKPACFRTDLAQKIQDMNDSWPRASSAIRRKKVIRWLEQEISKLEKSSERAAV